MFTVQGLTEKFKEKDTAYSGSATFSYESFMLTVLPFLIAQKYVMILQAFVSFAGCNLLPGVMVELKSFVITLWRCYVVTEQFKMWFINILLLFNFHKMF